MRRRIDFQASRSVTAIAKALVPTPHAEQPSINPQDIARRTRERINQGKTTYRPGMRSDGRYGRYTKTTFDPY